MQLKSGGVNNMWISIHKPGAIGSEGGNVLADEEYKDSCRITLEKCERYYAITCGVYEVVRGVFRAFPLLSATVCSGSLSVCGFCPRCFHTLIFYYGSEYGSDGCRRTHSKRTSAHMKLNRTFQALPRRAGSFSRLRR